jgi:hypothetical protein
MHDSDKALAQIQEQIIQNTAKQRMLKYTPEENKV